MLECDYLVIGTGASGMAFADAIVTHAPEDRTIVMIDKLSQPGGHWNLAYDFVKLHQPACFYGVASEKLEGSGGKDVKGNLSSKREILDYYRRVMDKLVKTGRVVHCGECTYQRDDWDDTSGHNTSDDNAASSGHAATTIPVRTYVDKEGISHRVKVKRRVVDATYLKIQVPSMNPPRYQVDPSVECVPINGIHKVPDPTKNFVVVGAGKTGIDAVLHLLDRGVDPSHIAWVMPRDPWLMNRAYFNPESIILKLGGYYNDEPTQRQSLLSQEKEGILVRIDENVWPEKYRCATVSREELQKLRSIRNVIRKGRVSSITRTHLVMTGRTNDGKNHSEESIPYEKGAVIVDCSSNGLPPRPEAPIFSPGKIAIQSISQCLTCLGAAMAAYVECHEGFADDGDRNQLMLPVPFPDDNKDFLRTELLDIRNQLTEGYAADPRTKDWFQGCRLNMTSHTSMASLVRGLPFKLYHGFSKIPASIEAKKQYYRSSYGTDFEHQIYSPDKFNKIVTLIRLITFVTRAIIFGMPLALIVGQWIFL